MAREHSAAGAGRACAAEASTLAGSVEAAKEPEYLEGSLAHLTAGFLLVVYPGTDGTLSAMSSHRTGSRARGS